MRSYTLQYGTSDRCLVLAMQMDGRTERSAPATSRRWHNLLSALVRQTGGESEVYLGVALTRISASIAAEMKSIDNFCVEIVLLVIRATSILVVGAQSSPSVSEQLSGTTNIVAKVENTPASTALAAILLHSRPHLFLELKRSIILAEPGKHNDKSIRCANRNGTSAEQDVGQVVLGKHVISRTAGAYLGAGARESTGAPDPDI